MVLDLLAAAPIPAQLAELAAEGIAELMRPHSPRLAKTLPAQILNTFVEQAMIVPGTPAFGRVIAGLARALRDNQRERADLYADLEARLEAHPLAEVLTSRCPARGQDRDQDPHHRRRRLRAPHRRTPRRLRRPAPATRPGDPPIRHLTQGPDPIPTRQPRLQERPVLVRIRQLRRPNQRAYCDRKRAAGKRHNAILICLARRRVHALFAMLRDPYRAPNPAAPHTAPVAA